jgi:hypothetical protein
MAYILAAERHRPEPEASRLWKEYEGYLKSNAARFPPGALALATSDWYFGFFDHRAPHDAWLEEATFAEPATGERNELRSLNLRVTLLGAYHDFILEFFYPEVFSYTLSNPATGGGHFDWRYDEFRLSEDGKLIHEIEWAGPPGYAGRWLIEASDVQFTARPRA